jgi:hypothetical protein
MAMAASVALTALGNSARMPSPAVSTTRPSWSAMMGRTASKAPSSPPAEPARDYKTVMARMNRAGWQALSILSIEQDRNLEDITIEALNDLLEKYGKPRLVEKRAPPKA